MSRCSRWPTSRMRQRTARTESASSRAKAGVASWLFPASGASWQPFEICCGGARRGTTHSVCPPGSVSSPTTTRSWACCGRPIERRCERSSRRATGVVCERLLGEDRSAMTATPFRMARIGRHGIVYGAGIVLSKAAAFAMLPIYTRYLSPADYGLLQLVQMVLEVASIIAGSRLGAGIFRFYHKAETPDERRAVLSTALIVLLSSLVTNIATGAFLACYLVRDVGLRFSKGAARDLLRFGVPFIGTQVATFILTFGDRYFLRSVSDTSAVGLYGLAYQFGFLLAMIGEVPFTTVWEPASFEIAKRRDRNELYARGFIYFNVVLLSVAVLIILFAGDFLRIVAAPAFRPAADLVPVIVLAYVLQSWTIMHYIGIQIRERTEFYTLANWAGAIVALAGYAVLIPRLLGLGAALATVAAFAVREGAVYMLSQRLWPVRYRWAPVLRLLVVATAACVMGVLLPQLRIWTSLSARVLLLLAYCGGLWHAGVLPADDRRLLGGLIRRPRLALVTIREQL